VKRRGVAGALLLVALAAHAQDNPQDPFEPWNRGVYKFNEAVDEAVLQPVATGYRKVVPQPIRTMVGNFFGNFGDAWSTVNLFLQGKPALGVQMGMRVATNSVLGIGGLLDIASETPLPRQQEDFGQTLGHWGMPPGPYMMLPLLGPSTLRDTAALPLDRGWSPALAFKEDADRLGLWSLSLIDARASLLGATGVLDDIALDKYSFLRAAFLARRRNLVYDGDPPEQPDTDDGAWK
jgi:phospholipid-binding lipoprotein MlaA